MTKLLLLGILGTAIVAMGTGFASNTFSLNLQQLGVSEDDLTSPINSATVDFEISRVPTDPDGIPNSGDEFFRNVITECSFHTPDGLATGSTIICKLTDINDRAIAEGRLVLTADLLASETVFIPIDQEAFLNANDVQRIHDVKIIALGPNPAPPAPPG